MRLELWGVRVVPSPSSGAHRVLQTSGSDLDVRLKLQVASPQ